MDIKLIVILLTVMFFLSGINKLKDIPNVAEGLGKRLPLQLPKQLLQLAIICAIVIEILAPLVLFNSVQNSKSKDEELQKKKNGYWASYSLLIFTIVVTFVYHFPPTGNTYYPFISNVTNIGGLMLLVKHFS